VWAQLETVGIAVLHWHVGTLRGRQRGTELPKARPTATPISDAVVSFM
jgi:hypothetical protein